MQSHWRTFNELIRPERDRYLGAIVTLTLGTLLAYTVPLICREALDRAAAGDFAAQQLAMAGLLVVALTAVSGAFMYLKGRWTAIAAERIAQRKRDELYDHLQHLPCSYFIKADTGDLVQRCTSDVETTRVFLASQIVEIGRALVMLAAVIPIMLWLDPWMTLVSLAVVPPIVAFSIIFFNRIKSAFLDADVAEGKMSALLQENLTGIRVVRAFARQDFECGKFDVCNADYRDKNFRLIKLLAHYWSLSDLMCLTQSGMALMVGAYWVMTGRMSVGTLFAFTSYVGMFLWPVRQLGRILTDLGKTQVALGRINEILHQPRESIPDALTPAPEPDRGEVVFENLTFSHATGENAAPLLKNISLTIPSGETLSIVGPSGAGKSTLMHLLLRLYDPSGGRIVIDGHDIAQLDRKAVRARMGAVMQEPFLFSKTLRENIKLGRPVASDDAMIEAASIACVHDNVTGFEHRYDTVVGERGVTLSGGQRQRVAIARAILKDAPILILDDALSAVDTRTESLILGALRERKGRRTTILIAHRLTTLMQADRIIVLDKGTIVQSGTHDSLIKEEGIYARLWRIQASLEEDLNKELQVLSMTTSN